jgi:hypothetical protein
MQRLKKERELSAKEWENKPTGKAIFEAMNKASYEEMTLDEEPLEEEELKEEVVEEEEVEGEEFVIDRSLYKEEEIEDVDFSDSDEGAFE